MTSDKENPKPEIRSPKSEMPLTFARPVRAPGLQGCALGQGPVGRVPSRGALGVFNSLLMQNPGSNALNLAFDNMATVDSEARCPYQRGHVSNITPSFQVI